MTAYRNTAAATACFVALLFGTAVQADEIRVLSSLGLQAVVEELAPRFEQSTTHRVTTVFDLAATLKTRIEQGAPFDVAILTPPMLDDLIAKGLVAAPSRALVARVGLGLMIRAGSARPDVSSVDAFKKTLVGARSVAYAATGASGVAFVSTIEKLGIAAAVKAKAKAVASGADVNASILNGSADLAVLPVSEILPVKGAELGGLFPADVQTYVVMAAGVNGKSSAAAREFVTFLMSPANDAVVKAKGMTR
jgi:molybdate transport system substrate-binding protein